MKKMCDDYFLFVIKYIIKKGEYLEEMRQKIRNDNKKQFL